MLAFTRDGPAHADRPTEPGLALSLEKCVPVEQSLGIVDFVRPSIVVVSVIRNDDQEKGLCLDSTVLQKVAHRLVTC